MFWDKKEEKKTLPELPPLPEFPGESVPNHNVEEEKHELPSFPDSLSNKGFSQAAIKDAVDINYSNEKYPTNAKTLEMEEWQPSAQNVEEPVSESIPSFEPESKPLERPLNEPVRRVQKKNSDIFVKLDKFYSARKALIDSQSKIEEIDELLKKLRETKMREEQELISWEKNLETVKSRINEVSLNLFDKVD